MQAPMSGNMQIPIQWRYSVESHIIPRLWGFEELEVIRKLKQFLEHESSKISYHVNTIGKTARFLYYGL